MKCWFHQVMDGVKTITAGEAYDPLKKWTPQECLSEFFDRGDYAKFVLRMEDFDWDTFRDFGADLIAHGAGTMPYRNCYVQLDDVPIQSETYNGVGHVAAFFRDYSDDHTFSFAAWRWVFYIERKYVVLAAGTANAPMWYYRPAKTTSIQMQSKDIYARIPSWGTDAWDQHQGMKDAMATLGYWFIGLINSRTYKLETRCPDEKLNKARKKRGSFPIPEDHVITIDLSQVTRAPGGNDGSHASPRPHWRRGHVRRLPSGKTTIVRPHAVMGGSDKLPEYRIKQ